MQTALLLIIGFVVLAFIVSFAVGKKRSWKNFKMLDGEKVEYEENGVKVNFSAPPKNTFVKANVKVTNKRIIILASNLFDKQGTVWWVFDYTSSVEGNLSDTFAGEYHADKKDMKIEKDEHGKEFFFINGKMSKNIYTYSLKFPVSNSSKVKEAIGF